MSITDPVADFITAIRNAAKAKKVSVTLPASKEKISIAEILKQESFIKDVKVAENGAKKSVIIYLKYLKNGKAAIQNIQKVSKPGLRKYVGATNVPKVLNGLGVAIVSTSKGIISGADAESQNVGGEVICKVW